MNCANLKDIKPKIEEEQHFPTDGLYIGRLRVNASEFPALVFLRDVDGICLLNNDFESRESVNKCLERLVWRIVTTIPPNMCEISVYNGGNPGDAFNSIMQINKYFFGDQIEKIYFAGTREAFSRRLEQLCGIIVHRMSKISGIGAVDAVEYNERVELDERMKYMFLFISDFPRYMNIDMLQRLEMLIHSGRKAGIYVMMAWNMTAEFENKNDQSSNFDPRKILETMMLIFPAPQGGGRYNFKNSGHDEIFNKYTFEYDDSLISAQDISSWGEFLNQKVEEAKKLLKPKVQKQDFDGLQKHAYEPISSDFSVTIGKDVEDAHVASLRFNSIDYIHA